MRWLSLKFTPKQPQSTGYYLTSGILDLDSQYYSVAFFDRLVALVLNGALQEETRFEEGTKTTPYSIEYCRSSDPDRRSYTDVERLQSTVNIFVPSEIESGATIDQSVHQVAFACMLPCLDGILKVQMKLSFEFLEQTSNPVRGWSIRDIVVCYA